MSRLLRITAPHFVAGAAYRQDGGGWVLEHVAPIVGWLRELPVGEHRDEIKRRGLSFEWIDAKHVGIQRVVSGGQTGADRAALDEATELGIAVGGWCPRGRRSEDGRIPKQYPLSEADSPSYIVRTHLNVEEAEATVLLTIGRALGPGTQATLDHAMVKGRHWIHFARAEHDPMEAAQLLRHFIRIAGWKPRPSGRLLFVGTGRRA